MRNFNLLIVTILLSSSVFVCCSESPRHSKSEDDSVPAILLPDSVVEFVADTVVNGNKISIRSSSKINFILLQVNSETVDTFYYFIEEHSLPSASIITNVDGELLFSQFHIYNNYLAFGFELVGIKKGLLLIDINKNRFVYDGSDPNVGVISSSYGGFYFNECCFWATEQRLGEFDTTNYKLFQQYKLQNDTIKLIKKERLTYNDSILYSRRLLALLVHNLTKDGSIDEVCKK